MKELETRLTRDLRTAADDVHVSGDAWQQNQRRIAAEQAQRRTRFMRAGGAAVAAAVAVGAVTGVLITSSADRDSRGSDRVPADRVPLPATTLLLPEELPSAPGADWESLSVGEGEGKRASVCQPQTLRALGATRTSHRTFTTEYGDATARQVVAAFRSAQAAATAFESVRGWFESCSDVAGAPVVESGLVPHARGRFETVAFNWLVDSPGTDYVLEQTGVAVRDRTLTILSVREPECCGEATPAAGALSATMRVALDRLSGRRLATEDAIPDEFRFSEEHSDGFSRQQNLFDRWLLADSPSCPAAWFTEDARRTGMLSLTPDGLFFQLAVYEDVPTAKAVAVRLREHVSNCEPSGTAATRRIATAAGTVHVTVDVYRQGVARRDGMRPAYSGATAQTAVQLGEAVFLIRHHAVVDDAAQLDVAEARALRDVQTSIDRNRARICTIAAGC